MKCVNLPKLGKMFTNDWDKFSYIVVYVDGFYRLLYLSNGEDDFPKVDFTISTPQKEYDEHSLYSWFGSVTQLKYNGSPVFE